MKSRIILLRVRTPQEKVRRLCEAVQQAYQAGESVLLLVDGQKAADYVDQMLWSTPRENFLPHVVSTQKTKDRVVITTSKENCNGAQTVVNLSAEPVPFLDTVPTIYELRDETSQQRFSQFQQRIQHYQQLSCTMIEK